MNKSVQEEKVSDCQHLPLSGTGFELVPKWVVMLGFKAGPAIFLLPLQGSRCYFPLVNSINRGSMGWGGGAGEQVQTLAFPLPLALSTYLPKLQFPCLKKDSNDEYLADCLTVQNRQIGKHNVDINAPSPELPRRLCDKVSSCNAGVTGSIPGSGRFPWRRKWQPPPVFLPGESHGQRSPVGSQRVGHKLVTKINKHCVDKGTLSALNSWQRQKWHSGNCCSYPVGQVHRL